LTHVLGVTAIQTGLSLHRRGRGDAFLIIPIVDHRRATLATAGPRGVQASRSVAGLATVLGPGGMRVVFLTMRGVRYQSHPFDVMTQQTGINAVPGKLRGNRWIGPLA
jgi:hypothetical protein